MFYLFLVLLSLLEFDDEDIHKRVTKTTPRWHMGKDHPHSGHSRCIPCWDGVLQYNPSWNAWTVRWHIVHKKDLFPWPRRRKSSQVGHPYLSTPFDEVHTWVCQPFQAVTRYIWVVMILGFDMHDACKQQLLRIGESRSGGVVAALEWEGEEILSFSTLPILLEAFWGEKFFRNSCQCFSWPKERRSTDVRYLFVSPVN